MIEPITMNYFCSIQNTHNDSMKKPTRQANVFVFKNVGKLRIITLLIFS